MSERRRLRRVGPHSAREAALGAVGLRMGEWVCEHELEAGGPDDSWVADRHFPEVDAAGLKESLWRTARFGRWQFAEEIMVLEARACEKGVQKLACGAYGEEIRQFVLLDNMSLVLCLARGRSRNFKVLIVL